MLGVQLADNGYGYVLGSIPIIFS